MKLMHISKIFRLLINIILLATLISSANARLTYELIVEEIAKNTYVIRGKDEPLNSTNGGMIANITFINTKEGVVLFDTGPSRRFGEQLRQFIEDFSGNEIVRVYNSHEHPDHVFGNQAFDNDTIAGPRQMIGDIERDGDMFSDNMYRLVGDWMRGTLVTPPAVVIEDGIIEEFDEHHLEVIATDGHTNSDVAIWDETTKTLIAGDLLFFQRALATPQANIKKWLSALDRLSKYDAKVIVPGHGPIDKTGESIKQTKDYLMWLDQSLNDAAQNGLSMTEVMNMEIPQWIEHIPLSRYEFNRSVSHLYRGYEEKAY